LHSAAIDGDSAKIGILKNGFNGPTAVARTGSIARVHENSGCPFEIRPCFLKFVSALTWSHSNS
jgi:hypothetical protein